MENSSYWFRYGMYYGERNAYGKNLRLERPVPSYLPRKYYWSITDYDAAFIREYFEFAMVRFPWKDFP